MRQQNGSKNEISLFVKFVTGKRTFKYTLALHPSNTCILRHRFILTSFWPQGICRVSVHSKLPVAVTKAEDSAIWKDESNLREFILDQELSIFRRYDLLTCVNIREWPVELFRACSWVFEPKLSESCFKFLDWSMEDFIRDGVVLTFCSSIHLNPSFIIAHQRKPKFDLLRYFIIQTSFDSFWINRSTHLLPIEALMLKV